MTSTTHGDPPHGATADGDRPAADGARPATTDTRTHPATTDTRTRPST
ncbi:hypothetical protein [Streptomyces sp. NEAU-L66]